MSKHTTKSYRVNVQPLRPGDFGTCFISGQTRTPQEELRLCETIVCQIRRHVDDIQTPWVSYDIEETCEFCGSKWTEGDSPHNGGCCHQDCEVFEKQEAEQHQ